MERKLIKQGKGEGGYTIYLPKKWIDENNLEKGSELSINQVGKDLIISTKPSEKKTETSIKLVNKEESSIRTLITNVYRIGYDRVNVNFETEDQFRILQKIIKTRLIGFDIISKNQKNCTIENITEPSTDQFDNLLKKLFLNVDELFISTKKRLENTKEQLEDYNEIEERIHKYDNFCRRVILKQKLIKQKSEMFWNFLAQIIHAQRELYFLNKLLNKKLKVSRQALEIYEQTYIVFNLIQKAYFNNDLEILWKIHEIERDMIYKKAYDMLDKNKDAKLIYHITSCLRQLHLATSPLSGLIS